MRGSEDQYDREVSEEDHVRMKDITEKISSHQLNSCFSRFLNPSPQNNHNPPETHPTDFSLIMGKINDKVYTKVNEWVDDMENIFKISHEKYMKNGVCYQALEYLYNKFNKKLERMKYPPEGAWLIKIREQIKQIEKSFI